MSTFPASDPALLLNPNTLQIDADPSEDELERLLITGIAPVVIPERELAEAALRQIMGRTDGSYGDVWVNDRDKRVFISVGDWEGNLVQPARRAAMREFPGYRVDADAEAMPSRDPEAAGWRRLYAHGELQEAVFDEKLHPRWPPESHDAAGKNIGGQFMRVGERFTKDGHTWEIAHVANGHVIANEASGDIHKVETRVFSPSQAGGHPTIEGAKPAEIPKLSKGEGASYTGQSGIPIVDAEAKADHDPSIALPAGSPLTPDEWQRFGKVDQHLYVELASRYGKWKQGQAKSMLKTAMGKYTQKAQSAVRAGFSHQYGHGYGVGAGDYLSLQEVFDGGHSLEEAKRIYREARELQGEIREINAWELMNRLRAPDVSMIHWGHGGSHNQQLVSGAAALKPGYSASWSSSITQFGSHATAFAMAARHVLLATDVSKPPGAEGYGGENELSNGDRLKLNAGMAHSFASHSLGPDLSKWFNDHFNKHTGSMRPGSLIKSMFAHMKGEGSLPLPPPPAGVVYDNQGKKPLYHVPPPEVIKEAAEKAKTAGYAHGESAEQALKSVESLGLEPGDLIEGHNVGKRYLVIADPGHATGLAYMKLDGSGTVYHFGSMQSERRKLEATVKLPPPPEEKGLPPFHSEQWTQAGALQLLSKMKPGEKVALQGDYFEVTGQSGQHTLLKSLVSGLTAKANAGHPTAALGPKPGFTPESYVPPEPEKPAWEPKEGEMAVWLGKVVQVGPKMSNGLFNITAPWAETFAKPESLSPFEPGFKPPVVPEKGDTFAHAGQKMVVTNVLKNGTVRARAPVPGAKVQDFSPSHPALGSLFRPADWTPGGKVKLGQMEAGQLVSGSPAKVRPYMVLGTAGSKTWLLNLDSGEKVALSKNKSWPMLVSAADAQKLSEPPPTTDFEGIPHDQWKVGASVLLKDVQVGDKIKTAEGPPMTVVGQIVDHHDKPHWQVQTQDGNVHLLPKNLSDAGLKFIYLGKAEQPPPVTTPTAAHTLENAIDHGFAPFKSNAGPGNAYKHDKVGTLAGGEHFFDKAGKLWKVKNHDGAHTIITDGQSNYHVDGKLRIKRAIHAKGGYTPLVDSAPPVGGPDDMASKATAVSLEENPAAYSLQDLDLQPGDKFMVGPKVWTVSDAPAMPGFVKAIGEDDGQDGAFLGSQVPDKYLVGGKPKVEVPAVGSATPSLKPDMQQVVTDFLQGKVGKHGEWHTDKVGGGYVLYHGELPLVVSSTDGIYVTPVKFKVEVNSVVQAVKGKLLTSKLADSQLAIHEKVEALAGGGKPEFFDSLTNGDKAAYDGPHGAKVVTVVDDQTPGPGITVKSDASGATFQAFKHQLSPHTSAPGAISPTPPPAPKPVGWQAAADAAQEFMTGAGNPPTFINDVHDAAAAKYASAGYPAGWSDATKWAQAYADGYVASGGASYTGHDLFSALKSALKGEEPAATEPAVPTSGLVHALDLKAGHTMKIKVPGAEYKVLETPKPGAASVKVITVKSQKVYDWKHYGKSVHVTGYTPEPERGATPEPAVPVSAPVSGPEMQQTVGDLKVGDKFVVAAGYSGAGTQYEVVDTTPTHHPALSGLPAYDTIKVKKVGGTATIGFASSHVPASVTPAKGPDAPPEKLGDLNVGDQYSFAEPSGKWTVVSKIGGEVQIKDSGGNLHTLPEGEEFKLPPIINAAEPGNEPTPITKSHGEAVFPGEYKGETVKDLGVGDVFKQSQSGILLKVLAKSPDLKIESVSSGTVTEPTWGDNDEKPVVITKKAAAANVPAGFEQLPALMHPVDLGLSPGDQFVDADGDIHTVLGGDEDTIDTSWAKPDWTTHGPMTFSHSDSLQAKAVKKAYEPPPEPPSATPAGSGIFDYGMVSLSGGKAAGGSQGAQIMTGPTSQNASGGTTNKWLLKTYGGDQNRVATELLANGVYRSLGVKVANAGQTTVNGKPALAYPLEGGQTTHFSTKFGADDAKREALGRDYMADALLANHDFVGLEDDNVLWNGNEPTRIDQGGTFEYRAMGDPKPFDKTPGDVWSMLAKGQGKRGVLVTESSMRQQATHIADTLTPQKINSLVDAAPFADQKMRERFRDTLKARVEWMREFGEGKHAVPADVKEKLLPEPAGPQHDLNGEELPDLPFDAPAEPVPAAPSAADQMASLEDKLMPPAEAEPEMPIAPYGSKWASGGAFQYPHIAELAPGDQFRDKEGTLYQVTANFPKGTGKFGYAKAKAVGWAHGAGPPALVIPHTFTDAKGKSKLTRVKKVEP